MSALSEIRQRAKQPWLIWPWLVFRFKQLLKVDFSQSREMFDQEPIDVVIPTIHKDYPVLYKGVPSLSANLCHPINKIFIVSQDNPEVRGLCKDLGCEFVDENSYLPVKKDSMNFKVGQWERGGWIFQQLLKFGADAFVERENFLIWESDTILLNPLGFIEKGRFVMGNSEEWHAPYFEAFERLFKKKIVWPMSFICQMMIFNKTLLAECKKEMETVHKMPWYEAYLSVVDKTELSSIADYETYAHWLCLRHMDRIIIKPFYNTGLGRKKLGDWQKLKAEFGSKYNSVSFHSYIKD